MPVTGKEKTILKQGLLIIGIMTGIYFFVLTPFLKEGSSILDEELERKSLEVKKYISRTGSLPSKKGFDRLEKKGLVLEKKLEELADFVDPQKTRISKSTTEAGLYFIEKLHSSMKEFSEEEALSEANLPENLGFGDGLPKESMVEVLLRQLETVEAVIEILSKAERIEFSAIKPLKAIDYVESLSKEVFYTELPIQVSIKTDTETLVRLLAELKNRSPVVSIKEMYVRSGGFGDADIEASLVLSTFMVARAAEQ